MNDSGKQEAKKHRAQCTYSAVSANKEATKQGQWLWQSALETLEVGLVTHIRKGPTGVDMQQGPIWILPIASGDMRELQSLMENTGTWGGEGTLPWVPEIQGLDLESNYQVGKN